MQKLPRPGKPKTLAKPKPLPVKHKRNQPSADRAERSPIKATPNSSGAVASHIEAVKYDAEKQHLTVTYRGGRDYTYGGVSQDFADGLEAAESKGRYLSQNGIRQFEIIR